MTSEPSVSEGRFPTFARLLAGRPNPGVRASLPFPWATTLLTLACWITTLPMFFDRRFYLILGAGHETLGVDKVAWWKAIVTPFVHGGGWPGTAPHLIINTVLFAILGTLTERTLGSGRFSAVTLTSLAIQIPLVRILVDGAAHGASGMTWSYLPFTGFLLLSAWRSLRRRLLRDPLAWLVAILLLLEVLGLAKHWHLWNFLVSIPFFLVWRKTLGRNARALRTGAPIDVGTRRANIIGIAVPAVLCATTSALTFAAVMGWLPTPTAVPNP